MVYKWYILLYNWVIIYYYHPLQEPEKSIDILGKWNPDQLRKNIYIEATTNFFKVAPLKFDEKIRYSGEKQNLQTSKPHTIHVWYIYLQLSFMVNVGTCTIPMDPMGPTIHLDLPILCVKFGAEIHQEKPTPIWAEVLNISIEGSRGNFAG